MNIIRSVIVDPASDVFWESDANIFKDMISRPLLILAHTYAAGSNDEAQLNKILSACQLKEEQYNIIKLNKDQKIAWHQLREKIKPKDIFLIGITPPQLGISSMFQLNTPNKFSDCTWLPTVSLTELEQNEPIRRDLWGSGMKPLFVEKTYGNLLD